MRGILTTLNRPLPAWINVLLFLVAISSAAVTVYNGGLAVPPGGVITDANAPANKCVSTNGSTPAQYTYGACVSTSAANTFTQTQNFNGMLQQQVNGTGSGLDHIIQFENLSASTSVPASVSALYSYLPNVNTSCSGGQPVAEQWDGATGNYSTNLGGYHVFWTKSDGLCSGNEVEVFTAAQHIYPAGPSLGVGTTSGCLGHDNLFICQITTPTTCSAGAVCGTVTVVFGTPYYQPNDTSTEQPYCFTSVADTNLNTNVWALTKESEAYNQIILGYAPLTAQASARTLNIEGLCFASSY